MATTVVGLEKQARAWMAEKQLRLNLARDEVRRAQQELEEAQLRWLYTREAEQRLQEPGVGAAR